MTTNDPSFPRKRESKPREDRTYAHFREYVTNA